MFNRAVVHYGIAQRPIWQLLAVESDSRIESLDLFTIYFYILIGTFDTNTDLKVIHFIHLWVEMYACVERFFGYESHKYHHW